MRWAAIRREAVTIDLDATQVTVYGQRKQGAARSRHGHMSYAPHVAFWAQRGRALTSELVGGNREKLSGADCARIARRAIALLPAGHGPVTMRIDSAYYASRAARRRCASGARASPCRCRATRRCGRRSPRSPRAPGPTRCDMPGAQVAETTYTPGRLARTSRCG